MLDSRSTVTAIAVAPGNRSTLYAATPGRGVYKSLDGGANWEPLNESLTNLDLRAFWRLPRMRFMPSPRVVFSKRSIRGRPGLDYQLEA
jgi:hypothetical protein